MTKEQEKQMIEDRLITAGILLEYAQKEMNYVEKVIKAWENKHGEQFPQQVKG